MAPDRERLVSFGRRGYRRWRLYIAPERLRMRKVVREWVSRLPENSFVLEIGGGTAFLTATVRAAVPGVRYVSGDIAPTDVTGVVLDANALPFASGSADAVLALEVLEHIAEPDRMIAEVARVLRPDGFGIVTVPFMFGVHDFRDYHRFTPLGFETLAARHDLDLVETRVRGGTFVAANGLLRTLVQNAIVGDPADWRASGRGRKVRWLLATVVATPWSLLTWSAVVLDLLFDRESKNPPGYFFLVRRRATGARAYSA